jgi:hypothetical protein
MSGAFLLNMFGGRMLFQDIQPHLHNKYYLKYIFIFCLFFIATKDINISLILIVIYMIFIQFLNDFKINNSENKEETDLKEKLNKCTQMLEEIKSKM